MITAYITFNGNTEEAFDFYKTALNGTITNLQRFGDAPNADQMSDADKNKIMHIALEGPDNIKLMGNDYLPFMGEAFKAGNNFSLSFHPDNKETADKLFNSLSVGGKITMPMSTAPWGDYFGMFTDKFGMTWMINHQVKQ
ncbi:MAG: VOC family protein [Bacteroidota bacterium]